MTRLFGVLFVTLLILSIGGAEHRTIPHLDTWSYVPLSGLGLKVGSFSPEFVTATRDGFVAVGSASDGIHLQSWASRDGVNWRPGLLSRIDPPKGKRFAATGIAAGANGVVAIGVTGDTDKMRYATWLSRDGHTWAAGPNIPPTPGQIFGQPDVVSVGDRIVAAVGEPPTFWELSQENKWRRLSIDLPAGCRFNELISGSIPEITLLGSCTHSPTDAWLPNVVLTEDKNGSLKAITDGLSFDYIDSVSSDGKTILINGLKELNGTQGGEGESPVRVIYRSTDGGQTWSSISNLPDTVEHTLGDSDAFNVAPRSFVIAGLSRDHKTTTDAPTLWTSTDDGQSWEAHRLPAYREDMSLGAISAFDDVVIVIANRMQWPNGIPVGIIINRPCDREAPTGCVAAEKAA